MKKRYVVRLSKAERETLEAVVSKGKCAAAKQRRARILLLADEGEEGPKLIDREVAELVGVRRQTVERIRQEFVTKGLDAIERKPYEAKVPRRKVDGEAEARLIALACSQPPKGYSDWSLRLLADKAVELKIVESISHESVRTVLKKTN